MTATGLLPARGDRMVASLPCASCPTKDRQSRAVLDPIAYGVTLTHIPPDSLIEPTGSRVRKNDGIIESGPLNDCG